VRLRRGDIINRESRSSVGQIAGTARPSNYRTQCGRISVELQYCCYAAQMLLTLTFRCIKRDGNFTSSSVDVDDKTPSASIDVLTSCSIIMSSPHNGGTKLCPTSDRLSVRLSRLPSTFTV